MDRLAAARSGLARSAGARRGSGRRADHLRFRVRCRLREQCGRLPEGGGPGIDANLFTRITALCRRARSSTRETTSVHGPDLEGTGPNDLRSGCGPLAGLRLIRGSASAGAWRVSAAGGLSRIEGKDRIRALRRGCASRWESAYIQHECSRSERPASRSRRNGFARCHGLGGAACSRQL